MNHKILDDLLYLFRSQGFHIFKLNTVGNNICIGHNSNKAVFIKIELTYQSNGAQRAYCHIMDNRLGTQRIDGFTIDGKVKEVSLSLSNNANIMNIANNILSAYKSCCKPFAITGKVIEGKTITYYQLCDINNNRQCFPKQDVFNKAINNQIQACVYQELDGRPVLKLKYNDIPVVKHTKPKSPQVEGSQLKTNRLSNNKNNDVAKLDKIANYIYKLLSENILFDKFSLDINDADAEIMLNGHKFGVLLQKNQASVSAYVIKDFGENDGWNEVYNKTIQANTRESIMELAKSVITAIVQNNR